MAKLSLKDLQLDQKKVLMRVDFNVPQDKDCTITDDTRIKATLPSIEYILDQGGKLILLSHLGRPKGKKDPKFSLKKVADRLSELLKKPVFFCEECIGEKAKAAVDKLNPGDVLLLENLRFHDEEEHQEAASGFAQQLASFGDVFVNEAFANSHRPHASIVMVPKYFKEKSAAGFLMEKEIDAFSKLLKSPKKPFYAIIGGAKVSSKLGMIKALLNKTDAILIGGAMAYTFLKASGFAVGNSLVEEEFIEEAKQILKLSENKKGAAIFLPVDHLASSDLSGNGKEFFCSSKEGIPEGFYGVDIGPLTIHLFTEELKKSKTVFWNGSLGIFEVPKFANGTISIAKVLASLKTESIVGGGDSIAALNTAQVADKIYHVSTGGGSGLEFLEYGILPGIEVLTEKT